METLRHHIFDWPVVKNIYEGKVRDVYDIGEDLIMVVSDRISAFDHILPRAIPYKGQVLNQTAAYFLDATKNICPNWLLATPDPNVSFGLKAKPIKLEMVIRGYLVGHAWRVYQQGGRSLCGVTLPEGMIENQAFPEPIITPATKAEEGHDEDISREEILTKGIVSEEIYLTLEKYTKALFRKGTEMAADRGLILVDTKYEFGIDSNGEVILIDEIHTPDSSRFFYADSYQELLDQNKKQRQLSKEFVREWLMENGFQGKEGQKIPEMPDSLVKEISNRYIELYETITGQPFHKEDITNLTDRIDENVQNFLSLQ